MHHLRRWADGGQTEQENAAPLCEACHKKVTAMKLRAWQQEALEIYNKENKKVFFLQACPGAGKTKFTLTALQGEMEKRGKQKTFIIVVTPSDSLRNSWMKEAAQFGIQLTTRASDGPFPGGPNYQGTVITYHALGNYLPLVKQWQRQANYKFILVCDEIHHTSESNSWGTDSSEYGELCDKIIFLSGTPNRSDKYKIPLANYENDLLVVDYKYGYTRALVERTCRKAEIRFAAFKTESQLPSTGELFTYTSESIEEDEESTVLRAALDTRLELAKDMILIAWDEIKKMRKGGDDNAACLVRCLTNTKAGGEDKYIYQVEKLIKTITGCTDDDIETVHSGIDESTDKIAKFKISKKIFLISVRQITEGVDIPRCRVLLHLDNTKAELSLRQELGRITRWEPDHDNSQHAIMVMPNIPTYMQFAKNIENDVAEAVKELEEHDSKDRNNSNKEKEHLVTLYSELTGVSSVMSGEVHNHEDPVIKKALMLQKTQHCLSMPLEYIQNVLRGQEELIKDDDLFSQANLDALNARPIPNMEAKTNDELSQELRKELKNAVSRVMHISKRFEKHKDIYNKIYELYPLVTPSYFKGSPIDYIERRDGIDGLKRCLKICREFMTVTV